MRTPPPIRETDDKASDDEDNGERSIISGDENVADQLVNLESPTHEGLPDPAQTSSRTTNLEQGNALTCTQASTTDLQFYVPSTDDEFSQRYVVEPEMRHGSDPEKIADNEYLRLGKRALSRKWDCTRGFRNFHNICQDHMRKNKGFKTIAWSYYIAMVEDLEGAMGAMDAERAYFLGRLDGIEETKRKVASEISTLREELTQRIVAMQAKEPATYSSVVRPVSFFSESFSGDL